MSHYTDLPPGEGARVTDMLYEVALDSIHTFFEHAMNADIIEAMEATEQFWPPERLEMLINELQEYRQRKLPTE